MIAVLGAAVLAVDAAAAAVRCSRSATTRSTPGSSGLPVRTLNLLLAVTTAVTVTVAMRAVGLLLVSALMVVPVATAQQVTRGFRATMALAMALGVRGRRRRRVWLAGEVDTAPGATIVLAGDRRRSLVVAVGAALRWRVRAPPDAADRRGRRPSRPRSCSTLTAVHAARASRGSGYRCDG